jgi:hypothetical protein
MARETMYEASATPSNSDALVLAPNSKGGYGSEDNGSSVMGHSSSNVSHHVARDDLLVLLLLEPCGAFLLIVMCDLTYAVYILSW